MVVVVVAVVVVVVVIVPAAAVVVAAVAVAGISSRNSSEQALLGFPILSLHTFNLQALPATNLVIVVVMKVSKQIRNANCKHAS